MKRCRRWLVFAIAAMLQMSIRVPAFSHSTTPPASPVKLIFIHHSTGGNWLASSSHDPSGGLGQALMDNNYYASATNYCWGPNDIGSSRNAVGSTHTYEWSKENGETQHSGRRVAPELIYHCSEAWR